MAHSYTSSLYHCVFSTKDRRPLITPPLQERLWPYLGGVARENKFKAICVGGVEDHVHLLLSLPSTLAIAKAIQLVKGGSSKWIHDNFPDMRQFAWQEGYGAFTVGAPQRPGVREYIARQAEHHQTRTFQEEYLDLLRRSGVEYDERYLW